MGNLEQKINTVKVRTYGWVQEHTGELKVRLVNWNRIVKTTQPKIQRRKKGNAEMNARDMWYIVKICDLAKELSEVQVRKMEK